MTELRFSDETLMAFADGELDRETQEAVERAMETDDDVVSRVALFIETRARAKEGMAPFLDEPVPDALLARVTEMVEAATEPEPMGRHERHDKPEPPEESAEATVVPFARRAKPDRTSARPAAITAGPWALPLAACLALVIGATGGLLVGGSDSGGTSPLQIAGFDQPGLIAALNSVRSGDETTLGEGGDRFRAIASYRDEAGTFCREFEIDLETQSTTVAVACRPQDTWNVQFTVVAGQNTEGYAPASSMESLEAYLNAVGAGEALSVEDEATLLQALR
ncbi:MAG: anti-sigma factor [Pseudomonadota bacterium]